MPEILLRNEHATFQIRDLKKGFVANVTKQTGELVINGEAIPFALRRRHYGTLAGFASEQVVYLTVTDFASDKPSLIEAAGHLCLLFTISPGTIQFSAYIKKCDWEKLVLAIAKWQS